MFSRPAERMTRVILISGKAQHGKDTAAIQIAKTFQELGRSVQIFHYGDLLKFICQKYFDWNGKKDIHGRTLLQEIGTDIVRNKNPEFWVNFAVSFLNVFDGVWDYVIIPDTRFPNEIDGIKNAGFDTFHLRVFRPNYNSKLDDSQQNHISETALDNIRPDLMITNAATIRIFNSKVDAIARAYLFDTL